MATIKPTETPEGTRGIIAYSGFSNGEWYIGDAHSSELGAFALHLDLNSGAIEITFRSRLAGSTAAFGTGGYLGYQKTSDWSTVDGSTTAITASGTYWVRADLMDVIAVIAGVSGDPIVRIKPGQF